MIKEVNKMLEQLDKDIEECWREYADAPKLSDEEIKNIIKDARRIACGEKKVLNNEGSH